RQKVCPALFLTESTTVRGRASRSVGRRVAADRLAGGRVEVELAAAVGPAEGEQVVQAAGDGVEGAADLRQVPVLLDEGQDRALVRQGVVDEVVLREGRDHQQREAGAVAAAPVDAA